jgi:hypothetical protein
LVRRRLRTSWMSIGVQRRTLAILTTRLIYMIFPARSWRTIGAAAPPSNSSSSFKSVGYLHNDGRPDLDADLQVIPPQACHDLTRPILT